VQWLASLGVGGILAGGMFMVYRQDRKDSEKRFQEVANNFLTVIQQNTEAMVALRMAGVANCPLAKAEE